MRILSIYILLLFSSLIFCSKEKVTNPKAVTPEDLLTRDNEISGWIRTGDHWTASSDGELSSHINGEAVVYTSRGFVEGAMQVYEGKVLGNTETVELRIFNQGTMTNAKSVFEEIVRLMSSPMDWDNGVGEEAKIERVGMVQKIVFYESKYYVDLSITSAFDEALDVLKTFANNVSSKIE